MRVRCTHCSAQVDLDDRQYSGRRMAQIRCWMCAQSSLVDLVPLDMNSSTIATDPLAPQDRPFAAARLAESSKTQTATLDLPLGKSITISVIDGPSAGFQRGLTMPLVTLGRLRGGADIEIDDPQVSRLHCAIEVKNDAVFLRDLRSTNGTYVAGKRVLAAKLDDSSEFRIGVSAVRIDIAAR
jgi:pSer/pThr/pTyr-binding forkhead associated (FHA) protein